MRWPWSTGQKNNSRAYLLWGRLEDVMSLIQVLALAPHAHRAESALQTVLRDKPQSAGTWMEIARSHSEFFRVYEGTKGPSASLVARHVLPKEGGRKLSPEFVSSLMMAAVQIHAGQLQRRQILRAGIAAGAVAIIPILASVLSLYVNISSWLRR